MTANSKSGKGPANSFRRNQKAQPTASNETTADKNSGILSSKWGPLPDNCVDVTSEESGLMYSIVGVPPSEPKR